MMLGDMDVMETDILMFRQRGRGGVACMSCWVPWTTAEMTDVLVGSLHVACNAVAVCSKFGR